MLPGPVFHAELMTLAPQALLRHAVPLRAPPPFLIWENSPTRDGASSPYGPGDLSIRETAAIGYAMFGTFAFAQTLAVILLTPALVAGVVAEERQRKTLQYLLTSCLTSVEIVLGKLAARMLILAVLFGVGMPILAMLCFFGGVDPNHVFLFEACCGLHGVPARLGLDGRLRSFRTARGTPSL